MQRSRARQIKPKQVLRLSVAGAIAVAGITIAYRWVKDQITTQTPVQRCWQPPQPTAAVPPVCYTEPLLLNHEAITAIAVSPDGSLLANAVGDRIQLWELHPQQPPTLRRTLIGHRHWITALAFNPNPGLRVDGSQSYDVSATVAPAQEVNLVSSSLDGSIKLWNLNTGALLATLPAGRMTTLAISPNGRILAAATRLVGWWNPPQNQRSAAQPIPIQPFTIQLWELPQRQLVRQLPIVSPSLAQPTPNPTGLINAIAFSPNGQYLAAGAETTGIWQVSTGEKLHTLQSNNLNALLFSQDGDWLLTGSDGVRGQDGIKFWDVKTGKLLRVLDSVAADFALNADGRTFATTYGGVVNLWRMKPFGSLGSLRGSTYSSLSVEFGRDRQIITGSSDGVRVWQAKTTGP
jgi:WD40 repeat protein